jgi:type II secretory pathway pseudopilin PulG
MSLIESAVAVAIAGTALAAVTPSVLRSREAYALQSTAQGRGHHALLRKDSMPSRKAGIAGFHVVSTTSYAVECQTSAGTWTEIDRRIALQGHTITANNRPEFHRRGNVSPTATITVWNAKGRALRVVVNANGRVRTQQ